MTDTLKTKSLEEKHISVLLNELVDSMDVNTNIPLKGKENIIVDCTLGM
jgi:16S rRNA C1402 N4-methylase RsmH